MGAAAKFSEIREELERIKRFERMADARVDSIENQLGKLKAQIGALYQALSYGARYQKQEDGWVLVTAVALDRTIREPETTQPRPGLVVLVGGEEPLEVVEP